MKPSENEQQIALSISDNCTVIIDRTYDKDRNKLKKVISYLSLVLFSYFFGLNHTSYLCLLDYSFINYPVILTADQQEIAQNLPPAFFFIGGIFGILFLYNMEKYNFKKVLQIICSIMILSYCCCYIYPHIGVIYAFRFFLGVSTSAISLIVPQLLYGFTTKWYAVLVISTFPFFLILGLGTSIALIPFSVAYYNVIAGLPIFLSCLTFILLLFPLTFDSASREKSDFTIKKFLTDERYMKSGFIISMMFLSCRACGVDFIGFFSSTLFVGPFAYWYSLTPFAVGLLLTFIGSFLPNYIGRKVTYIIGLCALAFTFADLCIQGPNIIAVLLFSVIYNCCCAVVPYIIPNEVVPLQYRSVANELGQISLWVFGFVFSIITVLLYKKGTKTFFLFFMIANLLCALIIFFVLPETKKLKEFDFTKKWINIDFFRFFRTKEHAEATI